MAKFNFLLAIAAVASLASSPALADVVAVTISPESLPYALNPSNYANSPSNYDNSARNYDNSSSNYDNSQSNYDNSPSNYDNRANGGRSIITEHGKRIGYYVWSDKGVLNFYSDNRRVAYMPSGGKTQSIFSAQGGAWCGTLAEHNGAIILAITQNCYLQFFID